MKSIFGSVMLAVALAGCGGGGTRGEAVCQPGVSTMAFPNGCPTDSGNGGIGVASIKLSLNDSAGTIVSAVSPDRAGVLQALVKDSKGAVAPSVAVTFTTSDKTGVFFPLSGTALTDATGIARVGLPAGAQEGAYTVTASATVSGVAATGSSAYAVTRPAVTLRLSLANAAGAAVTEVSPEAPGMLLAVVKDSQGIAAANVAVTFNTSDRTGVFAPSSGSALTDSSGLARIGLRAGSQVGSFTVTANASVGGAAINGTSDYAVTRAAVTVRLSMADASGVPTSQVSPESPVTLQALVKDRQGVVAGNVAVTFSTSDQTGIFSPASATALTDAIGVARIGLPAGSQAGGFTVTASTSSGGTPANGTFDYAVTRPAVTLRISLANAAGAAVTEVSPEAPGTLQALVKDSQGIAAANVAVTFNTSDRTGVFAPSSGSALTDSSGIARIGLRPGSQVGSFTVTANASVGGKAVTGTSDYAVTRAAVTVKLSMTDASGGPTSQVSPEMPGTLQALVKDRQGVVAANVAVTFSTSDQTGIFSPASATALTDANGVARIGLPAGSQAGGFTVTVSTNFGGIPTSGTFDYAVIRAAVTLSLSLANAAGDPATRVSPESPGTLLALVTDIQGIAAANVAVTFSTSDRTGSFNPLSGTALTDARGVARVGLLAGTQSGAFTVTASATVAAKATKGTFDYAVVFPSLTLGPLAISPATLSAGGNASVGVTVLSAAQPYTAPLSVAFTSPCISVGKATVGSPVMTQNGVARTSYSDKGCGVPDVITASVTFGDATSTRAGTLIVLPATAGSIKFVSAGTTNIALQGTGGFGRQEFSTLKFEVSDTTGSKVPGTLVDFVFADSSRADTVGGLTLNPSFATSAADGTVTTLVTAGTIPTSVRVVATLRGTSPPITTLSDILVVSNGVPDQKHFSLATSIGNCEGRDIDQACSIVTVTMGDHFGNPVPDGTAVNFSAEGGVIEASCVTGSLPPPGAPTPVGQTTNSKVGPGSGSCSVLLRSSRPRTSDGRVTVLAYALGEEDFSDSNGNNVYDPGEPFDDKRPDIFRDDNEDGRWNAGEPCVGPNLPGAGGARTCSTPSDAQYNGVLRIPQVPSPQTLYVSRQLVHIFSGSDAVITFNQPALTCPASGTVDTLVTVKDVNGNIMPAGTKINFNAVLAFSENPPVSPSLVTVNNVVLGVGDLMLVPTYTVTLSCAGRGAGRFFVTVRTPANVETRASIPVN